MTPLEPKQFPPGVQWWEEAIILRPGDELESTIRRLRAMMPAEFNPCIVRLTGYLVLPASPTSPERTDP